MPALFGVFVAGLLAACNGSNGATVGGGGGGGGGGAALQKVEFGRLVDVYGLVRSGSTLNVSLYQTDVLIGPDIQDEREPNSKKQDQEISYDFISANPDNLQPRLLITREIGTAEFVQKFDALDDKLRILRPAQFGDDTVVQPFSICPRNAALRLTFSSNLGIDDSFFVQRDANGRVIGIKNSEAVQMLKIVGDPRDSQNQGDFEVIPTRTIVRGHQLIIDPVLLGSEGLQYQTPNNAGGLPEAPDQVGANIRLALALEGPLRIPSISPGSTDLFGTNNGALRSIVRDFRSGNRNDDSADISRGFVRDPIPPRIVGEILMYLEKVEPLDEFSQVVTIFKNEVVHEIDRGDVLRFFVDNSGVPVVVTEVAVDPRDDNGQPAVKRVRAVVRRQEGLEEIDPTNRPDYPSDPGKLDAWLVTNAPKAVLVAEYTAERLEGNNLVRDDPRYFLTFSPSPLPKNIGGIEFASAPNENVSPFASAIVRFTKPIDLVTVKGLDTFFFATRDLFSADETDRFKTAFDLSDEAFDADKYATPHLVFARVRDEDGSQTSIRLQPELGFYLDEKMRRAFEDAPFEKIGGGSSGIPAPIYAYFLHLKGGDNGIRDLSGNPLDFQSLGVARDNLVIPFTLDVRKNGQTPLFEDNLAVTVARRFVKRDEDEQPSYYMGEMSRSAQAFLRYRLQDLFGSVIYFDDGTLGGRQTSRVTKIVDDLNQQPAPPQSVDDLQNPLAFCPLTIGSDTQVVTATAQVRFSAPLQNPLNPFGCRLQTIWREIDMSLSRTDPDDFNLDVEQMYWAPFTAAPIVFDEFDRESLFLGHSEYRTEPCVGSGSSLPSMTNSGLRGNFANNYVNNVKTSGDLESRPQPHPAYVDSNHVISPNLAFTEPNGVHRYLPLPTFEKPYFVWRDETVIEQGGNSSEGRDTRVRTGNFYQPFIISPFLAGRGRFAVADGPDKVLLTPGFWDSRNNYNIVSNSSAERFTGGLVGHIALPLLADFWTYPDKDDLPIDNPFRASGANGWQVALAVQSSPTPAFRAYSAGGRASSGIITVAPGQREWDQASGGINGLDGRKTAASDNTVFWVMADFLKRQTVATYGFVEITNPHRMPLDPTKVPAGFLDPRLGPFFGNALPAAYRPVFSYTFEPLLSQLPGGTAVIPEFRGAGPVDTASEGGPWAAFENMYDPKPNATNFPLDPLKAGDAHIRKLDDRVFGGRKRDYWTNYYNRNLTSYVADPNLLMDPEFTARFAGPNETFRPDQVKYFNWRFIMKNNVEANPPVSPVIDSFAVTYRFERQ